MKKLIPFLVAILLGCDSQALRNNLETYVCAYLPSAIDCQDPEVIEKAESILDNGMVEAQVTCEFWVPYYRNNWPNYLWTNLSAQLQVTAFHDGTSQTSCQLSGPRYLDNNGPHIAGSWMHYSGTSFVLRNNPRKCSIHLDETGGGNPPITMEIEQGVIHVYKGMLYDGAPPLDEYYDIQNHCTGTLNKEFFE